MLHAFPLLTLLMLAPPPLEPVAVPVGVSSLLEVGRYEVTYQRGQEDPVTMPLGWTGHFLPGVGVSVQQQMRERALFLHCPWMAGTGWLEVRYRLALPQATPITLAFDYAMQRANTEGSDGVTFGVRVEPTGDPAGVQVVLDQHTRSRDGTPVTVDLSPHAGKVVDVVFRVHPGPRSDSSFDFSLFHEPRIVVGDAGDGSSAAMVATVVASRQRWSAKAPKLSELRNRADQGVVPSTAGPFTNRVERIAGGWRILCEAPSGSLEYRLDDEADLASLRAHYEGGEAVPLDGGGAGYALAGAGPAAWKAESIREEGGALIAVGTASAGAKSARVTQRIRPVGKSLAIDVSSTDPVIEAFTGPQLGAATWKRDCTVPYLMTGRLSYVSDQGLYVGSVLDWTASDASEHNAATANYRALSDGSRLALRETAVISVSPYIGEVFPNIPNPPSPWIDDLAGRIVVDDWMGNFRALREVLETWATYGLEDLFVQAHVWQNGGYDAKLPDVLPANEGMGGDAEMIALAETARRLGYRFGVHENYVDVYPDAASWDEGLVARNPDGSLITAWYNEGTRIQSYGYRADAIVPTARLFTPEVHRRYGTTGSFIDVHAAVPPWFHVDFTAGSPVAGRFEPVRQAHIELWELFREVHGGPVMGEGNCHFFWGGLLDGAEAQVIGGEDHAVFADFDLLKMHPLVINHGMGYYARWLREGYGAGLQARMPLVRADKYRTQELLYGHAGFIGSEWEPEPRLSVKEAWSVLPLQKAYAAAQVDDVSYRIGSRWVDGSTALAAGATDVVRVRWDSGLELTANQSPTAVWVDGKRIPPSGYLASGGPIREAWIRELDGQIADYVADDSSVMVDARGQSYHAGRIPGAYVAVRPLPAEVATEGARQLRITYRWEPAASFTPDATLNGCSVFVHFLGVDRSEKTESIKFQHDHAPAVPFDQWRAGVPVEDGPYVVTVPQDLPAGEYLCVVGVWGSAGRRSFLGTDVGGQRYPVATVTIADDGSISASPTSATADAPSPFALWDERFNHEGKVLDFGELLTSGCARAAVEEGGSLRVWPLPQGVVFPLSVRPGRFGLGGDVYTVELLDGQGAVLETRTEVTKDGPVALPTGVPGVASFRVR